MKQRTTSILTIGLVLLTIGVLNSSCRFIRSDVTFRVEISEPMPWDEALGVSTWYLLRWSDPISGVHERYVPPGTTAVNISVSKGASAVFCAYPENSYMPLGGFTVFKQEKRLSFGEVDSVKLTYSRGAAADLLLKLEKYQQGSTADINLKRFADEMQSVGKGDGWQVQREPLYRDILSGSLKASSFVPLEAYEVSLFSLPTGYWIPDTPDREGFLVHTHEHVTISGFHKGTFHYLHPQERKVLTIVGSEDAAGWYVQNLLPRDTSDTRNTGDTGDWENTRTQ